MRSTIGPMAADADARGGGWVIVAPHFDQPGHLGAVRTDRFRRWLEAMGCSVVVVRAGSSDRTEHRSWGKLITVRDPLGFYRDPAPGAAVPPPPRPPNRVRTAVVHALFVPDPVIVWARRVVRSSRARQAVQGAAWVLSSSPPESCHLAAAALARRSGAAHLVDLRDGWLDEPMIPLLAGSAFQRWRHRRTESDIVARAQAILVTSERWRELLVGRHPEVEARIAILPNAYPFEVPTAPPAEYDRQGKDLTLLYAGKIHSSRPERRVAQLMSPLLMGLAKHGGRGEVEFIGNLRQDEIRDISSYDSRFEATGWRLAIRPPLPRVEMLRRVAAADGLLLLATSMASVPAKLFDYLPSRRPILAVTPEGSEVARIAASLPQLFVAGWGAAARSDAVVEFLTASAGAMPDAVLPEAFSESVLSRRFERFVSR